MSKVKDSIKKEKRYKFIIKFNDLYNRNPTDEEINSWNRGYTEGSKVSENIPLQKIKRILNRNCDIKFKIQAISKFIGNILDDDTYFIMKEIYRWN